MTPTMTLQQFVLGLIGTGVGGGAVSYGVARFLFSEYVPVAWSPQMKRLTAMLLSAAIGVAGLALGQSLGYVEITAETIFTAAVTAFTTSQLLHGAFDLGKGA